ncbi:DUF4333 domain-containing protein [Amycolatopsis sp. CA-230715]|uniref:DUF4333 domain-containing protein n=1 Tax=Amycolatopsis sp. CA-230715 TaxID=2745196 RepID=UPI001C02E814|nr:DUF4333 domain-containing protein [Amycolatopsis sp. CA-230715]QWF79622.1 hypothetical protein HUW46_03031 [Amycolatopsis sp. CA-230715]
MNQPPQQPGWWQPPAQPQPQQPWSPGPASPPPGQGYSGQPPQPGYGGGFQPSTSGYGGFGAFNEGAEPSKPRSKKPFVIGGAVALVLVLAGAALLIFNPFKSVLDQNSLQEGVTAVLHESYGEGDVRDVNCPSGESVSTGTSFTCSVTVAGAAKTVSVRVLNDKPEYEVGAPK